MALPLPSWSLLLEFRPTSAFKNVTNLDCLIHNDRTSSYPESTTLVHWRKGWHVKFDVSCLTSHSTPVGNVWCGLLIPSCIAWCRFCSCFFCRRLMLLYGDWISHGTWHYFSSLFVRSDTTSVAFTPFASCEGGRRYFGVHMFLLTSTALLYRRCRSPFQHHIILIYS